MKTDVCIQSVILANNKESHSHVVEVNNSDMYGSVCVGFQQEAHLGVTAGDVDGVEVALVLFASVDKFPD